MHNPLYLIVNYILQVFKVNVNNVKVITSISKLNNIVNLEQL